MAKIFSSLLTAYIKSSIAGFLCILMLNLFADYDLEPGDEIAFYIAGQTFLNFFISFLLCLIVFLPIAVFDKERIEKNSFEELVSWYLPIITLPLAFLFCLILFSETNQSEHHFLKTIILAMFCFSYVGLWTFIKKLKS